MPVPKSENRPIRVLHAVTYMGRGGLETMIMNYYRHIDRRKVQFDFLVHRDFPADYDNEIEELGGSIHRLPRLIPWSLTYRKTLKNFFQNHGEYRIVHSHLNCFSPIVLKAAKNISAVRIAHSHICGGDRKLSHLIKLFYRRLLPKYATHFFACGKAAGDWLFRGAPYKIIHNAIDTDRYTHDSEKCQMVRQDLGLAQDAFVIGHVGRFDLQKNHTFLLDIFAEVKKQEEKAVLLLVGDGKLRPEMEEKVRLLGISDSVIFTGVRSDVPDLMQAMDCFLFPSLYEGLPVVMVEAQAAGLPCFISDGVSSEAMMTKTTKQIPLAIGATSWAEHILEEIGNKRPATKSDIVNAGYDIKENAKNLQNFYLEQWEREV